MLDGGADVAAAGYDDRTALHLAAAEGHLDAVALLIDKGARVNAPDRWRGTPLRDAEDGGHTAVVEYLRGKGATPFCRTSSGSFSSDSASPRRSMTRAASFQLLKQKMGMSEKEPKVLPSPPDSPLPLADTGGPDDHAKPEAKPRSEGSCQIS